MHAVVTLVERDFLYGAAALYNSLVAAGFDGRFVIGYRSEKDLPAGLLAQMRELPAELPKIEWMFLETSWHFANFKAEFILEVFDKNPTVEKVTYFDPDIVVTCPWKFISAWTEKGVALCSDVNWWMAPDHPIRKEWVAMLKAEGLCAERELHHYFNSGFLGLRREDAQFARLWHDLTQKYGGEISPLDGKGGIKEWRRGGRWERIHTPDQDTLNLTCMSWEKTISTVGPDAMGFAPGNVYFPHAIGDPKPWRKSFFTLALQGSRPSLADQAFWRFCNGPVTLYPPLTRFRRRFLLGIASMIGRFYSRK